MFDVLGRISVSFAVFLFATAAIPTSHASDPIYTRAEIVEGVWTQIEIARQYEATRVVPIMDCPGEPYSCTATTTFAQLYEITASKIVESISADGGTVIEEVLIHREMFATDLGAEAERVLEEKLAQYLESLHALSSRNVSTLRVFGFAIPLNLLFDESKTPTWMCMTSPSTAPQVTFLQPVAGGGYGSGHPPKFVHEEVCNLLRIELDAGGRQIFVTPGGVKQMRETSITVDVAFQRGSEDERALTPIPSEMHFQKAKRDPAGESNMYSERAGGVYRWTHESGSFKKSARSAPVSLSVPTSNTAIWATRWQLQTTASKFGAFPTDVPGEPDELYIGFFALDDGVTGTQALDLLPPPPTWRAAVGEALSRRGLLDLEEIAPELRYSMVNMWAEAELGFVVCSEDRASFGLAAFSDSVQLMNGPEVCDKIRALAYEP